MDRKILNRVRAQRKYRTRKIVGGGTPERPRLTVFRSNHHIHAQIIDDRAGHTLVAASSLELDAKQKKQSKLEQARAVGVLLAKKATQAKIDTVVFDRGGYRYHGRVKALAEGARENGLTI